jgi:hypothetical protein
MIDLWGKRNSEYIQQHTALQINMLIHPNERIENQMSWPIPRAKLESEKSVGTRYKRGDTFHKCKPTAELREGTLATPPSVELTSVA